MRHTNGLPVFTQLLPIIWHMTDFISAGNTNYVDREETGDRSSKTNIIVKPDGSRVLVVTMNIGGMETNMSIKISEATDMQNDSNSPNNTTQQGQATGYMPDGDMAEN